MRREFAHLPLTPPVDSGKQRCLAWPKLEGPHALCHFRTNTHTASSSTGSQALAHTNQQAAWMGDSLVDAMCHMGFDALGLELRVESGELCPIDRLSTSVINGDRCMGGTDH